MATIKIKTVQIGSSLSTILSNKIGDRSIVSESPMTGPHGGSGWMEIVLSDGEVALIGEKMFSWRPVPKWILSRYPDKKFITAGSGDRWRAYISGEPITDGCVCQNCGKIYRIDFIVPNNVWEQIKPTGTDPDGGMLCGRCIVNKMETIYREDNKYGKFDIK